MQFARINGISLHYRASGLGTGKPAIAFVNSLGTDLRIWQAVAEELSPDFAILAYDKRGHGLSDIGQTPYAMADHAADLAGLMEHLDIRRAIVCGVSVGGQIALQLSFDRPSSVAGLVLSNTAAKIGDEDFWSARMTLIAEKGLAAVVDGILERWFSPSFRDPANPAFSGYRNMLTRQSAEGYLATCAAIRAFDRRADLAHIAVPAACIGAEFDGATPPAQVEELAAGIADARYELISGAGHIPCVEAPGRVAEIVRALVQRVEEETTA
jgi:3-oxoadipate enol-lactonase